MLRVFCGKDNISNIAHTLKIIKGILQYVYHDSLERISQIL